MKITSQRLAERARALMPALAPWFGGSFSANGDIELVRDEPQKDRADHTTVRTCLKALNFLEGGAVPTAEDFAPAACEATPAAPPIRYDVKMGVVRTLRPIQQGETLAAIPPFALAAARPGQRLFVKAQVGPVSVEREVRALQPAKPQRALFVEASDGTVFSAPPLGISP